MWLLLAALENHLLIAVPTLGKISFLQIFWNISGTPK
jgi:hypothetical protein